MGIAADAINEDRQVYLGAGANDYIDKIFNKDKI